MPELSFQELGSGPTLLLIHGFPMNSEVWNEFRKPLSKHFHVITIDLPGFGTSSSLKEGFSIDDVAEIVIEWLEKKKINNCVVVGHSLGGYVALAMARKKPEMFAGVGLFHSTAQPDSDEKKVSRLKVVEFIERNGVLAFTSNFIPQLFADQEHPAIEKVRSIAIKSTSDTVKGYTLAMRNRPSSSDVLENFDKPVLFLAGSKDGGIPVETILHQASLCQRPDVQVLEGVAHMGMFENSDKTAAIIIQFSETCFAKFPD
ncbi:MAG TPA: alpha/beta hydrolase [Cyclobacteriaceae bacterium]|nr:alpha/beta hydrolase [Cyclobacteriaceae bacterium]